MDGHVGGSIHSTIHPGLSGAVVKCMMKDDGPVLDDNLHMGGVALSDQLLQYYSVHHKTARWYPDSVPVVSTKNAYSLHQEISKSHQVQTMSQWEFQK